MRYKDSIGNVRLWHCNAYIVHDRVSFFLYDIKTKDLNVFFYMAHIFFCQRNISVLPDDSDLTLRMNQRTKKESSFGKEFIM